MVAPKSYEDIAASQRITSASGVEIMMPTYTKTRMQSPIVEDPVHSLHDSTVQSPTILEHKSTRETVQSSIAVGRDSSTAVVDHNSFDKPKQLPTMIDHDSMPRQKTEHHSRSPDGYESTGKILVAIMCKDEEAFIAKTLESILDVADSIVILDTGSTDRTVDVIRDVCRHKSLYIYEHVFEDFATTRNKLLQKVDEICQMHMHDLVLLMDANDILLEPSKKILKSLLLETVQTKTVDVEERLRQDVISYTGYYVHQEWQYSDKFEKYQNIRIIKPGCGWYYQGAVHENLVNDVDVDAKTVKRCDVVLYQDRRNGGDGSSLKRYTRDLAILHRELTKPGIGDQFNEYSRNLFYLGQTYQCLGRFEEAIAMYKDRIALVDDLVRETKALDGEGCRIMIGNVEEYYHAIYRIGLLYCIGKNRKCVKWLLRAFETWPRAEPLVRLCEAYMTFIPNVILAYAFAEAACQAPYPEKSLLFVAEDDYEDKRYRYRDAAKHTLDEIKSQKKNNL